jgi:hypothetical protein
MSLKDGFTINASRPAGPIVGAAQDFRDGKLMIEMSGRYEYDVPSKPEGVIGVTGIETGEQIDDNSPIKQIEFDDSTKVTVQNTLFLHQEHEQIDNIYINSPNVDIFNQCSSENVFLTEESETYFNADEYSTYVFKLPNEKYGVLKFTYNLMPCYTCYTVETGNTSFYNHTVKVNIDGKEKDTSDFTEFLKTDESNPFIVKDNNLTITKLIRQLQSTYVYSYNFYNPLNQSYTLHRYLGPVIQSSGVVKYGNNIPKYNNVIEYDSEVSSYTEVTYIGNAVYGDLIVDGYKEISFEEAQTLKTSNKVYVYNSETKTYDVVDSNAALTESTTYFSNNTYEGYWTIIDDYDNNSKKIVRFYSAYDDYQEKYSDLVNTNSFILTHEEASNIFVNATVNDYKLSIGSYGGLINNEYFVVSLVNDIDLNNLIGYTTTKFKDNILRYSQGSNYDLNGEFDYSDTYSYSNVWFTFSYFVKDEHYNNVKYYSNTYNYDVYDKVKEITENKICDNIEITIVDRNNVELNFTYSLTNPSSNKTTYLGKLTTNLYNSYLLDDNIVSNDMEQYESMLEKAKFTEYQFPVLSTYLKKNYAFANDIPSYEYVTQELVISQSMLSTYWIYNSILDEYVLFEPNNTSTVLYYEGDFYGIESQSLVYTYNSDKGEYIYSTYFLDFGSLSLESVTKRAKFNTSAYPGQFIESKMNNVSVNNHVPFYLSNAVDKIPTNEFVLNSHKYSYVIKKEQVKDTAGTYVQDAYNYEITPVIVQDEYWEQIYEDKEKPFKIDSNTTISHPLTVSSANILSGVKESIMGYIIHPRLTYKDYVITYNKVIEYGYYDTYNLFRKYYDKTYDINGITYGILSIPKTAEKPAHQELITLNKFTTVKRDQQLTDLIYQEEYNEPITALKESSWGMINGEKLVIDEEIYNPPTYVDVKTINPITGEYEVRQEIGAEAYLSYKYHYETVPFITNTYLYQTSPSRIENLENIIENLSNTNNILLNGANSLVSTVSTLNSSLSNVSSNISTAISGTFVGNIISDELTQTRSLTNSLFTNLISSLTQVATQSTNKLDESIDIVGKNIVNAANGIVENNASLQDVLIKSNEANTSNFIDSLKKQLGNINTSISNLSGALSSSQSSLTDVLTELASKPQAGTTYINISPDENGNVPEINLGGGGGASSIGEKIKNYNGVREIGKIEEKLVEVEKNLSIALPGQKAPFKQTVKVKEKQKVVELYDNPKPQKITYVDANNETMHAMTSQIGLHKKVTKQNLAFNDKVYELEYTTYEGIADVLAEMSRRIPTKQEFVIDVAKQLYINTAFDIESSYKAPADHAKTAIQRALVMWTELEKNKYVKPATKDNTLAYALINQY